MDTQLHTSTQLHTYPHNRGTSVVEEMVEVRKDPIVQHNLCLHISPRHYVPQCSQCWHLQVYTSTPSVCGPPTITQ